MSGIAALLLRPCVSLLCIAVAAVPAVVAQHHVIDLSQPWTEGPLYNKNKAYCTIQSTLDRNTRGYVVVQNGAIVAEAYTPGNNQDGIYRAFSTTKSFSTMLIGSMVQSGLLSTNETLGDIFHQDSDWIGVKQAEEKKTVTLEELLTMTSGLVENYSTLLWIFTQRDIPQDDFQQIMNSVTYTPSKRGTWQYLGLAHILAQIMVRRSDVTPGLTPRELARPIFAQMGIAESDYDWRTFEGVEGTAFGLQTNPRVLAKLGQLYLQSGVSAPGTQLIPQEWVESSTTDQLDHDEENFFGLLYGDTTGYGYQWYTYKDGSGTGPREGMALALGAYGQVVAFLPERNVTIAIMANECRYGDLISGVLLNTIVDNIDNLDVAETDCKEGWIAAQRTSIYYFTKYSIAALPGALSYFFSMIAKGRIPILG